MRRTASRTLPGSEAQRDDRGGHDHQEGELLELLPVGLVNQLALLGVFLAASTVKPANRLSLISALE